MVLWVWLHVIACLVEILMMGEVMRDLVGVGGFLAELYKEIGESVFDEFSI